MNTPDSVYSSFGNNWINSKTDGGLLDILGSIAEFPQLTGLSGSFASAEGKQSLALVSNSCELLCIRVYVRVYLLDELSKLQHRVEGSVEVFAVWVIGVCVWGQNLKQSHILVYSPHRAEQQLLQTSQTHRDTDTLCTYPCPQAALENICP